MAEVTQIVTTVIKITCDVEVTPEGSSIGATPVRLPDHKVICRSPKIPDHSAGTLDHTKLTKVTILVRKRITVIGTTTVLRIRTNGGRAMIAKTRPARISSKTRSSSSATRTTTASSGSIRIRSNSPSPISSKTISAL